MPCRAEIVSKKTGKTLAVDATGNGSFADGGDQLVEDRNRDGYPDLLFKENDQEFGMELLVSVPAGAAPESIHIKLQLRTSGDWEDYAEDIVE